MKALFLAGGMGTRLQPLTDKLPKPMVPIMNKPLLERTMLNLKKCGISEVIISTCYQSDYIKDYFGDGSAFDLKIDYIVEDQPMGTGGAIKKAEEYFDETFIVFNADVVSDIDLRKMINFHQSKQALATIAVTEVEDPSMYGVIEYDANGYAISFKEKPKPGESLSNSINVGTYIFEPAIFKEIAGNRALSVEREVFPDLLKGDKKIGIYQSESYWMDIGSIQKYMQVHIDIMNGKCKLVECNFNSDKISFGKNVNIHPTSKIIGPTYIGDNVTIGEKVIIKNSVIGNNVKISANSRIVRSILWENDIIEKDVRLMSTIIIDNCYVEMGTNLFNTVHDIENTPLVKII